VADDPDPITRLAQCLLPQQVGADLFTGENPQEEGRLYGGLVAAQAVVAAGCTVPELPLHSLHGYFLRPGAAQTPITYRVERSKEGRNFHARRVEAIQGSDVIFSMLASFAFEGEGVSHQAPMPAAPRPEQGEERSPRFARSFFADRAIETRFIDPEDPNDHRRFLWIRPRAPLPPDILLHTAVLVFMSDRALVSTAALPHRHTHERRQIASLDHAFWIHRHVPFTDWVLYAMESPAAHGGRGLIFGAMYSSDGTCIATSAQEGLLVLEPK
jgi:acyl-CoA thioesterase-2